MNRRDFLKGMAAGAATTAFPTAIGAREKKGDRPNIVLLLTDDQDKESIGAFGGKTLSPNLDRMARDGIKFNQAYVSSTVCTPSRYTFLTGRYAGRSHSKRYRAECPVGSQGLPAFNMELEEDNMNVGNILRRNGYVAGYVGKFHVGPDLKREEELKEHGLQYLPREAPADRIASAVFKHNECWYREQMLKYGFSWAKNIYWGNLQKPFAHHNPEWNIDAALEFIEENKDRPFYLHYCTTLLHGPDKSWRTSMDHPKVSGEGLLDEPPKVMTDRKELLKRLERENLDPEQGHAGNIWIDDSIGAVLNKLDELGIGDNTLVAFIPDHGSNMKGSLFDVDGVNVPCIMRWPKGIKAGMECDELIQNIDFAPTFFDAAGANIPEACKMDGRSLLPLFQNAKPGKWRNDLYFEIGAARAVRTKDWKYICVRYTKEQVEKIRRASLKDLPQNMSYFGRMGIGVRGAVNPNFFDADQLYYVKEDPKELKNLAHDPKYKNRLAMMKTLLTDSLKKFDRPFGEFVPGGNAAPGGSIDKQIAQVKTLKIQGKTVILPDGAVAEEKAPATNDRKRQEREKRRSEKKSEKKNP